MAVSENGYNSVPRKAKKPTSRYMASTTLSDRTIEKIIWYFLGHKTNRFAAKEIGINKMSVNYYYNLLLIRLCSVGFFKPREYYISKYDTISVNMETFFEKAIPEHMSNHRGISIEKMKLYEAKYATEIFYFIYSFDIKTPNNSNNDYKEWMYTDIQSVIRITGPLNRPPINIDIVKQFINTVWLRRMPRALAKEYRKQFASNLESKRGAITVLDNLKRLKLENKKVKFSVDYTTELDKSAAEYTKKYLENLIEIVVPKPHETDQSLKIYIKCKEPFPPGFLEAFKRKLNRIK